VSGIKFKWGVGRIERRVRKETSMVFRLLDLSETECSAKPAALLKTENMEGPAFSVAVIRNLLHGINMRKFTFLV
jgi:hypothetical protein